MNALTRWVANVAAAVDRLLNAATGGDPRMTLSARMGRDISLGRCALCRPVCAVLGWLDKDHCARSWASEQQPVDASQQIVKE
jgi:hypothetical protein